MNAETISPATAPVAVPSPSPVQPPLATVAPSAPPPPSAPPIGVATTQKPRKNFGGKRAKFAPATAKV